MRAGRRPDSIFLGLLVAVIITGLVVLTSASGPTGFQKFNDSWWFLKHQVLFGLLPGFVLFFVASKIDYQRWRAFAPQFLVVSVLLLLSVFIPGLGTTNNTTALSWLDFGLITIQPVEVVKLTFLCYVAAWLESHQDAIKHGTFEGVMPFLAASGIIAVLIMLQPDLGSLMVIGAAAFTAYFVAGARWSHIAIIATAAALGLWALIKSAPYRAARFMTFLHPELDPQGVGYHINQAYLAIGSGGWMGQGLGHSQQKLRFLPEVSGDSIFAVMAEEFGFVLTLGVLALFLIFLWKCVDIARRAPDPFGRFLAAGIVGWICGQLFFNIGSMVGILPLTGLPMPFVSYGGTALAVLLGAMGMLANISSQTVSTRR